jgi:hypothetical protein
MATCPYMSCMGIIIMGTLSWQQYYMLLGNYYYHITTTSATESRLIVKLHILFHIWKYIYGIAHCRLNVCSSGHACCLNTYMIIFKQQLAIDLYQTPCSGYDTSILEYKHFRRFVGIVRRVGKAWSNQVITGLPYLSVVYEGSGLKRNMQSCLKSEAQSLQSILSSPPVQC